MTLLSRKWILILVASIGVLGAGYATSIHSGSALDETPTPTTTATASSPTPTASPTPLPSPTPISTVSPTELLAQRTKWNAAGIASYRYVLETLCFCGPITVQPFTITVRDGVTHSVADQQGKFISLTDADYSLVAKFATVDALFGEAARLSTLSYHRAEVSYDAVYGFPTRIASDPAQFIADDELTIVVRGFQIVQPDTLPRMGGRP